MSQRLTTTQAALDRMSALAERIENREAFVRSVETRVDDIRAVRKELDESIETLHARKEEIDRLEQRTTGLSDRLTDADRRFVKVAERSEDAAAMEATMDRVGVRLAEVEQRGTAWLSGAMESAEQRNAEIDALGERLKTLGGELADREAAIAQATAGLQEASKLRSTVSSAIRQLEGQGREVAAGIASANEQITGVTDLTERLEARAGSLRFAEKRITLFEEKLVALEQAENSLKTSIHGIDQRQQSVDAVREELAAMFERTDKTLGQVRSISRAKKKVEATKEALDEILRRAEQVDEIAEAVDRRRAEIEEAENRMGHMEALVSDLRSGLRTLSSEKAMVDAAIEKASDLSYEVKEAEAVIRALKDERKTSGRVLDALKNESEGHDYGPLSKQRKRKSRSVGGVG